MEKLSVKELRDLNAGNVTAQHLPRFAKMTSWFNPILLIKLLKPVILSGVFGQYADRRLIMAALDTATGDEHFARAVALKEELPSDELWLDYVSDTGDGFDSTYAIAHLLAQSELKIGEHTLKRGQVLTLGGDQVYPTANRYDYMLRFVKPFQFALPESKAEKNIPLFALPGNHDWYDGLVMFLAMFAREIPIPIGRWETRQLRSYFAAQLTEDIWLWGIDIALVHDMDQPQNDYFVSIASKMKEGSSIILCSAEPGWYEGETEGGAYETLGYIAYLANTVGKKLKIPLILSGDSHHYARYETKETQFITSGGGGAFSHGTLQLEEKLTLKWWRGSGNVPLERRAAYPSEKDSKAELWKNVLFAPWNMLFSLGLGFTYFLASLVYIFAPLPDSVVILFLLMTAGLWGYSLYQEHGASKNKTLFAAAVHSAAHISAIVGLTTVAICLANQFLPMASLHWAAPAIALLSYFLLVGGFVAGSIFGLNLLLSCRLLNMNHNDAFSSLRLKGYKHFLRIRIKGQSITVFPIKLDNVPKRHDWVKNTPTTQNPSVFSAPLNPELIEQPISISLSQTITTEEASPR